MWRRARRSPPAQLLVELEAGVKAASGADGRSTRRCATPCAASWRARSRRTPPPGTRRRNFRASCTSKAAAAGLLGIGFPEEYGGTPADLFTHVILAEEIALAGVGGVHAGLFSHQIGAPPVARAGSAELKARVLPPVLAGEKISALAITEPGGGSDVANLRPARGAKAAITW